MVEWRGVIECGGGGCRVRGGRMEGGGGDRMWVGVGRMLGGGGLVVIEMVGGCRIRGGGEIDICICVYC